MTAPLECPARGDGREEQTSSAGLVNGVDGRKINKIRPVSLRGGDAWTNEKLVPVKSRELLSWMECERSCIRSPDVLPDATDELLEMLQRDIDLFLNETDKNKQVTQCPANQVPSSDSVDVEDIVDHPLSHRQRSLSLPKSFLATSR